MTHDELIALAEGEPGPGSKTYELFPMAVKLLLPEYAGRIWRLIEAHAYTEACIALMGEVLPDHVCDLGFGSGTTPSVIIVQKHHSYRTKAYSNNSDLPRAFLIAILRAHCEVVG